MTQDDSDLQGAWKKSRRGAWAGRGFHYQHLVSTALLVRQWVGLFPVGRLVPEGLDDCVIEFSDHDVWIQIKSREAGVFGELEVQKYLDKLNSDVASSKTTTKTYTAVVLEQPRTGAEENEIDHIIHRVQNAVVCFNNPWEDAINNISTTLQVAEIIAEGVISDLYLLVADSSAKNGALPFEDRRRISVSEVDSRINYRLEAEDSSVIDSAVLDRKIEPINFSFKIEEPSFYLGVKTQIGHVTAGLVIDRPEQIRETTNLLRDGREVLIAGPSGAGKSGVLWLTVHELAGHMRWFQVSQVCKVTDVDSIIKYVRARRPNKNAPIGLAFDEVNSLNSGVWSILAHELRAIPFLYLIGSIRREDLPLLPNQARSTLYSVELDQPLAEHIWQKLSKDGKTEWKHWLEPFQISKGLMLEYIHLLTQGRQFEEIISDQIRQREAEGRVIELNLIRNISAICARGGEVNVSRLCDLLEIEKADGAAAFSRLIDEHIIRESRPGVIGGMHALRTKALHEASHDEIVYLTEDTLWACLLATTIETLPFLVQSVLMEVDTSSLDDRIRRLAEGLEKTDDIDIWSSVLTGMGLATLESYVILFISEMEKNNIQRAHWSLGGLFADTSIDIVNTSEFEQWGSLMDAVSAFRSKKCRDFRFDVLRYLSEKNRGLPYCYDIHQANRFLHSIASLLGRESPQIEPKFSFEITADTSIYEIAPLLGTASTLGNITLQELTAECGGEKKLLERFYKQTPWVKKPAFEENGDHGRTIRANLFYLSDDYHSEPNQAVVNVCETLISICPSADAAASDMVTANDDPVTTPNGDRLWCKNMPRQNIPIKSSVAWNVAFRKILLTKSVSISFTDYCQEMSTLLKRTEKVFKNYSEKWIKGTRILNRDVLEKEIQNIINATNNLNFSESVQSNSNEGSNQKEENFGALIVGVLGNLVRRLNRIPGDEAIRATAVFAGGLADDASEYESADMWRFTNSDPRKELLDLSSRLRDVSGVLHELSIGALEQKITKTVNIARKGLRDNAFRLAALNAKTQSERRQNKIVQQMKNEMSKKGISIDCAFRNIKEGDTPYWPGKEIAITVFIDSLEDELHYLDEVLFVGAKFLKSSSPYRVVPVFNGWVLTPFALFPTSGTPLPDTDFAKDWEGHIELPFLTSGLITWFDDAIRACLQLSGALSFTAGSSVNEEEENALENMLSNYQKNLKYIEEVNEGDNTEHIDHALEYIYQVWNRLVDEFESYKKGLPIANPLHKITTAALAGEMSDELHELKSYKTVVIQGECLRLSV